VRTRCHNAYARAACASLRASSAPTFGCARRACQTVGGAGRRAGCSVVSGLLGTPAAVGVIDAPLSAKCAALAHGLASNRHAMLCTVIPHAARALRRPPPARCHARRPSALVVCEVLAQRSQYGDRCFHAIAARDSWLLWSGAGRGACGARWSVAARPTARASRRGPSTQSCSTCASKALPPRSVTARWPAAPVCARKRGPVRLCR
jgi:hypothetical protein